ncbi:hypothetical protein L207DRAFT_609824 [Hyaloscypha variabilis F]|uniref:Uncharacterized protein n=1 Tax=Hyaloscypha variabilis (strain UAMH 11265 / GT02V1 / F) TaxID=1149755 RepID=A0A2J6R1Q8_HYAVF|nr:hypothetical protein L207DRAFT_609824 [Hyaloscypha variabilis F]
MTDHQLYPAKMAQPPIFGTDFSFDFAFKKDDCRFSFIVELPTDPSLAEEYEECKPIRSSARQLNTKDVAASKCGKPNESQDSNQGKRKDDNEKDGKKDKEKQNGRAEHDSKEAAPTRGEQIRTVAKMLFPQYFVGYNHIITSLRQINVRLTNANDKTLTKEQLKSMKLKRWQGGKKSNVEKVWRKMCRELKNLFKALGRWEARQTARVEDIMRALRITKNRRDAIDRRMRSLQLRFGLPPKSFNIELDWEHDEGDCTEEPKPKLKEHEQALGSREGIEELKKEMKFLRDSLTLEAALSGALEEELRCLCRHCGWDEQERGTLCYGNAQDGVGNADGIRSK